MRYLIYLLSALLCTLSVFGAREAFVVQDVDSGRLLVQEGDVADCFSPYCTFNLVLSLIGFEKHILQDAYNPEWPFKEDYREDYLGWNDTFPEKWAISHHPKNWMKNSCVWFSQVLAKKIGKKTLTDYVTLFEYGNKNLLGDGGNGLTRSWIGSSLRISPLEQICFINRFLKQALFVSVNSYELTKEILFVEELPNGMMLYGKSGSGNHGRGQETVYRTGWFVGWVEIRDQRLSFAYLVHGTESGDHLTGAGAREQLKQRLLQLNI